ncbi:deazapurine DNA modification protein DpdA family protein [Streptomyces decoyicus]
MKFFLGTHMPGWLELTTAPLFISDRRLRPRKRLPVARGSWALDSGAFTELQKYGSWDHGPSPVEYAERVRRYRDEVGGLLWASPLDWMCEPIVIHGGTAGRVTFVGTKLSVAEHQRRTVANFLELRAVAPDLPFVPVIQGHTAQQYLNCVNRYHDAGVDLSAEATVGIGSVCRRQATKDTAEIIAAVCQAVPGIRLHGYGIKIGGLGLYGGMLASADSLAWSFAAFHDDPLPGCRTHKNCANCPRYAFRWREQVLASSARHATGTASRPAYELGA